MCTHNRAQPPSWVFENALTFLRVYSMYSCHIRVRMKLVPADFGASKGKNFGVCQTHIIR